MVKKIIKKGKQQVHLRKINNKLIMAGKGVKDNFIGKLVVFNNKIYTVVKKNKSGTYNLKNLTENLHQQNVPKYKLRIY